MNSLISKSSYISSKQCHKLLWFELNGVKSLSEIDPSAEDRKSVGEEVGSLAKQLFPGGIDIAFQPDAIEKMVDETKSAISKGGPVYEATFVKNDMLIRVDLMVKTKHGWNIYEVKSSSKLKDYHYEDASFQWYVLSQISDIELNKAFIVILNDDFILEDQVNVDGLFKKEDVTKSVISKSNDLTDEINLIRETMRLKKKPNIKIGKHCMSPHKCQYKDNCWDTHNKNSVLNLYRMNSEKKFHFYHSGIKTFEQLPHSYQLTDIQKKQVLSCRNSQAIIDQVNIDSFLKSITYPISYLDFETFQEAVPSYDKQKPYMQMPFQFSLHIQKKPLGALDHFELIATPGTDPRPELAEKLIKSVPEDGTIIAYNQSFEMNCIKTLAEISKDHKENLEKLNERFLDLIIPFRKGYYYHPDFNGSFSIKKVLPALCPNDLNLSYDGLNIKTGSDASLKYKNISNLNSCDQEILLKDLYNYCKLDTLAMVKILEHLILLKKKSDND